MKVRFALVLASFLVLPNVAWSVCTPTIQWIWDGDFRSPEFPGVCVSPLVVQLTDDNGDGQVDSRDRTDVIFTHGNRSSESLITAVDGWTSAVHFTISDPKVLYSGLAVGDIDGDCTVEIVAIHTNRRQLVAFEHTGTLKWTSDLLAASALGDFDAVGIADLDQDGVPEIYVGATVFNADGRLLWQGAEGSGGARHISNAVDLVPSNPGSWVGGGSNNISEGGNIAKPTNKGIFQEEGWGFYI